MLRSLLGLRSAAPSLLGARGAGATALSGGRCSSAGAGCRASSSSSEAAAAAEVAAPPAAEEGTAKPKRAAPSLTPRPAWTPKSKRPGAMAMKVGMVPLWDEWGVRHPCTVLQLDQTEVVQLKTVAHDGYDALQIGVGEAKNVNKPQAGHYAAAGVAPKRKLEEFKVTPDALLPPGTPILARHFVPGQCVDVTGYSIGKGFAGVMKRHNFSGQRATHGNSKTHRHGGSYGHGIGGVNPARVHKGKKMSGRMGNARSYMQNLEVRKVDAARNLIYVRGAVAGKPGSFCKINDAKLFNWEKRGMTPPFPTFLPEQDEKEGDPDVFYPPKDAKDPML